MVQRYCLAFGDERSDEQTSSDVKEEYESMLWCSDVTVRVVVLRCVEACLDSVHDNKLNIVTGLDRNQLICELTITAGQPFYLYDFRTCQSMQ